MMGLMSSRVTSDQRVVIIGGGYAGNAVALALIKLGANVTIIDSKEYLHHNIAGVRTFVDKSYSSKMLIPYAPTYGAHYRHGKVTRIDTTTKTVSLEGGDSIAYDILVIATGSKGPMKEWELGRDECVAKYTKYYEAVKASSKIVVVGGGPTGVEIAAEIASIYPDKSVTLIHGSDRLVWSTAPDNFTRRLTALIEQFHIKVVYGEKVTNMSELGDMVQGHYEVKTSKGQTLEADLVIQATGLTVNTAAFATSLAAAMEPSGALRVNEFLQVEGYSDIFALGDCSTADTLKTAAMAGKQAEQLSANIGKLLNKKNLTPFSPPMKMIGLSFGRHNAVGCTLSGWMLPEFVLVYVKSKDLLLSRFYGEMKQPVPK